MIGNLSDKVGLHPWEPQDSEKESGKNDYDPQGNYEVPNRFFNIFAHYPGS